MRRRAVLVALGGAALCAQVAARAEPPGMPAVGYLGIGSPETDASRVTAFRQGLHDAGLVEGSSVALEFRWAYGDYHRLPALAAELVGRQVAVIAACPLPATVAAKTATATVPIVFANGNDPVRYGLVAALNRPGANVTGVTYLVNVMAAKQLEVLHEVVPKPAALGFLENPNNPNAEHDVAEVTTAADRLGRTLLIVKASSLDDLEPAFSTLASQHVGGLLFHSDAFFSSRSGPLAALALGHGLPAVLFDRAFPAAGGLMSYGGAVADGYRQAGIYAGRILKGEKPADLPVLQTTKVELIINLKTARALGLTIPPALLARADEVIE